MKKLSQQNAIVTGCSYGLGPYIARELARQGVNIMAAAWPELVLGQTP